MEHYISGAAIIISIIAIWQSHRAIQISKSYRRQDLRMLVLSEHSEALNLAQMLPLEINSLRKNTHYLHRRTGRLESESARMKTGIREQMNSKCSVLKRELEEIDTDIDGKSPEELEQVLFDIRRARAELDRMSCLVAGEISEIEKEEDRAKEAEHRAEDST